MRKLIDVDAVKKKFPIMENDFGMVINETLHKELDKIPPVEAIPKDQYEARLKADMVAILDKIRAEILQLDYNDFDAYEGTNIEPQVSRDEVIAIINKYCKETNG